MLTQTFENTNRDKARTHETNTLKNPEREGKKNGERGTQLYNQANIEANRAPNNGNDTLLYHVPKSGRE